MRPDCDSLAPPPFLHHLFHLSSHCSSSSGSSGGGPGQDLLGLGYGSADDSDEDAEEAQSQPPPPQPQQPAAEEASLQADAPATPPSPGPAAPRSPAAAPRMFRKGERVLYRKRLAEGSYRDVEAVVLHVDLSLQPPAYSISVDGQPRETEGERLKPMPQVLPLPSLGCPLPMYHPLSTMPSVIAREGITRRICFALSFPSYIGD